MKPRNLAVLLSACVAIVAALFLAPQSPFGKYMVARVTIAELVIKNAVIYTSDPSFPWAQSMAISSGRVLAVGNLSSLQGLIGQETRIMDLKGKVVVPGLIDSHVHFISGGLQMAQVDLHAVKSKSEFISKVKQAVQDMKKEQWVLGGGWNDDHWGGELPEASWIDNITHDHPVWLSCMDGHMGLANSVALEKVGIHNLKDDPVGGIIVKNIYGAPTGLLVDAAMQLLLLHIPEATIQERRDAMLRASKLGLSRGVTAVVDFGRYFPGTSTNRVWQDFFEVYKWADETSRMLLRVCLFFPLETWSLVAAYADDESNHGLHVANPDWLLDTVHEADKFGIQVAIHAIGDKANDIALSINEALISKNGMKDRRFRIEHAQHLAAGAIDRFGANDVIASVQPEHLLDDAATAIRKLGERRAVQESYLFNSLLSNNARLALGSDWPVAELDPLGGIIAAVKRTPPNWQTPWIPSESITVDAALNGYTISAAFAAFMENEIGSLSTGKCADFVVLSKNPWNVADLEDFPSVQATYIGGIQVYP